MCRMEGSDSTLSYQQLCGADAIKTRRGFDRFFFPCGFLFFPRQCIHTVTIHYGHYSNRPDTHSRELKKRAERKGKYTSEKKKKKFSDEAKTLFHYVGIMIKLGEPIKDPGENKKGPTAHLSAHGERLLRKYGPLTRILPLKKKRRVWRMSFV